MSDGQFERLTVPQLKALLAEVEAAITRREGADRAALRDQFSSMAEESGYTLAELFAIDRTSTSTGKVAAKFRNPEDASQTWSGRGRMPRWLAAELKAGARLDDFRI